jgi:hypothetical protein
MDVRAIKQGKKAIVRILSGGEQEVIVKAPCANKGNGHWYCITHKEHLEHNFAKDTHIRNNETHLMGWVCNVHGLEEP